MICFILRRLRQLSDFLNEYKLDAEYETLKTPTILIDTKLLGGWEFSFYKKRLMSASGQLKFLYQE